MTPETTKRIATALGYEAELSDAVQARKTAEKNLGYHENHGKECDV